MNVTALKRIGNSLQNLRQFTSDLSDQSKLTKLIDEIDHIIVEDEA